MYTQTATTSSNILVALRNSTPMQEFLKPAVKHADPETKRLWNKLLLFKKKLRMQLMKELLSKNQFLRWLLKNRFDRAFKVHLNPV
jgi:hypothetical protein